ncbi:MAG: hypothetical protein ABJH72_21440 [Reichenbachiella sp.]|uniref:hypothetical protein n=1 Tax=Reichenbachiella sp. TaxID=2184521 RepID=UPI003298D780
MIKSQIRTILAPTFILSLLFLVSCESDESEESLVYVGPWIPGWPQLGHDGEPYESDRFIVYSNFSSFETKVETSEYAESIIDEVLEVFEVTWDDYRFVASQSNKKIVIFSDHDQRLESGGLAYRDGIIIRALHSPLYEQNYTLHRWKRTLKHELTHVNEFLLIGDNNYRLANTVWFREGIANYISENQSVSELSHLEVWQEKMKDVSGGGNPIGIKVWGDFPQSQINANAESEYYAFFELGIRYLLDSKGNGSTISDVKSFYEELGNGISVAIAFENNFGLSLNTFEAQYWDLMTDYLSN